MNALELQRLVDGQLTHSQRADLLQAMEACDPKWREIALRLLEEQQWAKEICLGPARLPSTEVSTTDSAMSTVAGIELGKNKSWRTSSWWNALLASCALFAIGLYGGYQFRYQLTNPMAQQQSIANSASPNGDDAIAQSSNAFEVDSPWRVRVDSPSASPIEIPLLDAREIDPNLIFANNSFEIAKLNQQLKRKGYELDVKPSVYSGSLKDGRKFVVPIHDVSLKPFGL